MNKKNGFTLIEILGIIVIITIIGLIVFVSIDRSIKNGKEKALNRQLDYIELATENYLTDNLDMLPSIEGNPITIKLGTLKIGGYTEMDVSNPNTGKCFSNDLEIKVEKYQDIYKYNVDRTTLIEVDDCSVVDILALEPIVTISGEPKNIGKGQFITLKLSYNISSNDVTDKIDILIDGEVTNDQTSSYIEGIDIGEEVKVTDGYERYVYIKISDTIDNNEEIVFQLRIKEDFIKNQTGKGNEEVLSNEIILSTPPIISDISEPELVVVNWGIDNFTGLTGFYSCSDSLNLYQGVKIYFDNADYISYEIVGSSVGYALKSGQLYNARTEFVEFYTGINDEYTIYITDNVGQTNSKTFIINQNDCEPPIYANSYCTITSGCSNIYSPGYFEDEKAGVKTIYTFLRDGTMSMEEPNITGMLPINNFPNMEEFIAENFGGNLIKTYDIDESNCPSDFCYKDVKWFFQEIYGEYSVCGVDRHLFALVVDNTYNGNYRVYYIDNINVSLYYPQKCMNSFATDFYIYTLNEEGTGYKVELSPAFRNVLKGYTCPLANPDPEQGVFYGNCTGDFVVNGETLWTPSQPLPNPSSNLYLPVVDMSGMFFDVKAAWYLSDMYILDLSLWDFISVTNFTNMFDFYNQPMRYIVSDSYNKEKLEAGLAAGLGFPSWYYRVIVKQS